MFVVESLTYDQEGCVVRHRKPVSGTGLAADDNFEASVRAEFHVGELDFAGRGHRSIDGVTIGLAADAEIGDRIPFAADTVGAIRTDDALLVEIVRVIGADLNAVIGEQEKAGKVRIGGIDEHVERRAGQPAEIAQSFSLIDRGPRRGWARQNFGCFRKFVAKVPPDGLQAFAWRHALVHIHF